MTRRSRRRAVAAVAASLWAALAGCSDPEYSGRDSDAARVQPEPLCEDFAPCGGDPAGVWNVELICLAEAEEDPSCPDVRTTVKPTITGLIELRDDGTYTRALDASIIATSTIPRACVGPLVCDLRQDLGDGALSCTDAGPAGCLCNLSASVEDASAGAWTLDGGQLTLTDDTDGRVVRVDYCVEGDAMFATDWLSGGAVLQMRRAVAE